MASTLFEEDVVQRTHRNTLQLGLVIRNHDWYSSDDDDSEDEEEKIKKGYVRVAWYPKGREFVVPEKKVSLYDRSVMPGDAVRRNHEGSQRGIVRSVHVSCHLRVIRTKQMIYDVSSQNLENIMMFSPSCHVVMGSWIGVVRSIYVQLIVRLKNGARCALPDDSACRLTDIHDTDEDESVFSCDSFFPGQVLRGPATTFKNATWLSGQQPILSSKANFTVTVEEVNIVELDVHWQTRGLCRYPAGDCTDSTQLQPPPRKVTKEMLPSVKPLSYFIAANVQIGDKVMYRIRPEDLVYPKPVPRGSLDCYIQPPKGEGSEELAAGKGGECSSHLPVLKSQESELKSCDEQGKRLESAEKDTSVANGDPKLSASTITGCLQYNHQCVSNLLITQNKHIHAEHTSCSSSNCCADEGHTCISCSSGAGTVLQEAQKPDIPDGEASGITSENFVVACVETVEAAQLKALSDLHESLTLQDHCASNHLESDKKAKSDGLSTPRPSQDTKEDKQELLARAEVLKVGLSRDVDLLGELHRELCDASESVTDIAKSFRTLLQRASNESAREISGQVSRLLDSQGKLKQQILMTEGLLVDSKKSLKELDDIEMETRGAAMGKPAVSKTVRKARGQAAKNKSRQKFDDKDANQSSDDDEDSSDGLEDSDDTDSNASSKGESRRHKVVSSLLQRHTKKQHMRLTPKRRPPPKALEAEERVCVEVTHTRTLVDVMWQDGTLQKDVVSTDLFPVHQLDDLEYFPGDFVTKNNEELENVYGLVCRTDHKERTCLVQWIIRPNQQCNVPKPTNTEEVSVYELTPHPDFTFNVGDVVVRIADSQHGITPMKKGKPDPKGTSPCTQIGNPGTQNGNTSSQIVNKAPQMSQDGTHFSEPNTQMGSNAPDISQYSTSELSTQRGNVGSQTGDSATQMGNHVTQIGNPSTQVSIPSDYLRTTNTLVNHQDVEVGDHITRSGDCDDCAETETQGLSKGENHLTDNDQLATNEQLSKNAASLHPCLRESQTPIPQLANSSQKGQATKGSVAQAPGCVMDQRGTHDSPEAEKANVDRMNLANLKTGPVLAAGGTLTFGSESSSEIKHSLETQEEPVPCAGQVRWINTSGEIHVAWIDGSESNVLPQDLYKLEEDSDSDWSDNDHDDDDWKDDDKSEDSSNSSSSSWETASDASRSSEEVNIISPPTSQETPNPSPVSLGGDAVSSETQDSDVLPEGLEGATFEQTFSALSMMEDKIRRINWCATSILESRTGLSLMSTDANLEKRTGVPEASQNQGAGGCAQNDKSQVTNECAGTSETCTQLEISTPSQSDFGDLDLDSETEMGKAASPASTSPTELAASEKENNCGDGVRPKDSNHGNQETCPKSPTIGAAQTAAGQSCDNFFLMEDVPQSHHFVNYLPEEPKQLSLTMRREMRLLQTSLPQGIKVKGFADRMDLFSVLFEGPSNTPYEDGLFFFDARLPQDYPKSPPIMHYHAYCSGQLNPNLYNDGKVCVSLLGTWTGKGSEMWTSKSNLLQVLVSIQGLILVSEPYYNEAGYEKHRGSQPGKENSRLYNEMAVLKMVQSMTLMLTNPPDVFHEETINFCRNHGYRMLRRIEHWLCLASASPDGREPGKGDQDVSNLPAFTLLPLSKGFILSMKQALRAYRAALGVGGVPDN